MYNPLLLMSMRRITSPTWEPFLSVGGAVFYVLFDWDLAWTDVGICYVWFFLQGLGVAVNQLYQIFAAKALGRKVFKELGANAVYTALCRGLTFTWFTFSLLWFWADWKQLREMASALQLGGMLGALLISFLGAAVTLTLLAGVRDWALSFRYAEEPVLASRYVLTVVDTAQLVVSVCVVLLFVSQGQELVYDAF